MHWAQHDSIGNGEGLRQRGFKNFSAHGIRSRLKRRPEPATRPARARGFKCRADGRRMMRGVVLIEHVMPPGCGHSPSANFDTAVRDTKFGRLIHDAHIPRNPIILRAEAISFHRAQCPPSRLGNRWTRSLLVAPDYDPPTLRNEIHKPPKLQLYCG